MSRNYPAKIRLIGSNSDMKASLSSCRYYMKKRPSVPQIIRTLTFMLRKINLTIYITLKLDGTTKFIYAVEKDSGAREMKGSAKRTLLQQPKHGSPCSRREVLKPQRKDQLWLRRKIWSMS